MNDRFSTEPSFSRTEGCFGNCKGVINTFPHEDHNFPLEAFEQHEVGTGRTLSGTFSGGKFQCSPPDGLSPVLISCSR